MPNFGQEPFSDPLDPFDDPANAMPNAFGPDANFELFQARLEELLMDDLGRMLNQLEEGIENSQPIPLEPQSPQLPDSLTEHLDAPPNVSSAAKQNNGEFMSEQTITDTPALPYYIEEPQRTGPSHKPAHLPTGGTCRRGGRGFKSSHAGPGDKIYCPIEKDYVVFPDFCEAQDCEYYDEDSDSENGRHCSYYDEEGP